MDGSPVKVGEARCERVLVCVFKLVELAGCSRDGRGSEADGRLSRHAGAAALYVDRSPPRLSLLLLALLTCLLLLLSLQLLVRLLRSLLVLREVGLNRRSGSDASQLGGNLLEEALHSSITNLRHRNGRRVYADRSTTS